LLAILLIDVGEKDHLGRTNQTLPLAVRPIDKADFSADGFGSISPRSTPLEVMIFQSEIFRLFDDLSGDGQSENADEESCGVVETGVSSGRVAGD
jgi:hypothetical protein